ncbi:MAG: hypothetical protein AAF789_12030, partial [Bacteroidota bacterium]
GGKIRGGITSFTEDKSTYSFYIVQVNKGLDDNLAYVSFFEPLEGIEAYNASLNDYLSVDKLRKSFIQIACGDSLITISSRSTTMQPEKSLGGIYGYSVFFEGRINKTVVKFLQRNYISSFKISLGGKPYERTFQKPTKSVREIKSQMNCVDLSPFYEVETKDPLEMDLSEVPDSLYSDNIIGKWLLQSDKDVMLEFHTDKLIVTREGKIYSEGTYNIAGKNLIYTGTKSSGLSVFEIFVRDMIVLREKGVQYTYERVE